jgi:hypothetical protein
VNIDQRFCPQVPTQANDPAGGRELGDGVRAGGAPHAGDHLVQGRQAGRGDQAVSNSPFNSTVHVSLQQGG